MELGDRTLKIIATPATEAAEIWHLRSFYPKFCSLATSSILADYISKMGTPLSAALSG